MPNSGSGRASFSEFEAILKSIDPDEPLGTDEIHPDGATPDEVMFWVNTYREVVELETKVLATIRGMLPLLGARARQEAELTNVPLISGQLERFRFRLALWEDVAKKVKHKRK